MARNLSEAISLFNSHRTKLHLLDLKPIEELISPRLIRDPDFLTFSEKFGPIMTHCHKLFSLLRDETFINDSTLPDCERILKIFQNSNKFFKYQKFLDLYTDKLLRSPIPHQTAPRLANLLNSYNQFNMLPRESFMKYISGDYFNLNNKRKFCVTEALLSIYANLRFNDFHEYRGYAEMFDKILTREIPNALKYELDIKFSDKINLCYSLSISNSWKYTEIWNSILGKLAKEISKEANNLENTDSIKLLQSLDGIQCFAPELMLRNREAIYEIYQNLQFDTEPLKKTIHKSKELDVLIQKVKKMRIDYEESQIVEGHYTAQLLIDPKIVVNCLSGKMFIRNSQGDKTDLELASLKYVSNVLKARGYRYVSIPEYKLRSHPDFQSEKIIQENIINPM